VGDARTKEMHERHPTVTTRRAQGTSVRSKQARIGDFSPVVSPAAPSISGGCLAITVARPLTMKKTSEREVVGKGCDSYQATSPHT